MTNYYKSGKKFSEGYILFNSSPDYEYLKIGKWIYYDNKGKVKKQKNYTTPQSTEDIDVME